MKTPALTVIILVLCSSIFDVGSITLADTQTEILIKNLQEYMLLQQVSESQISNYINSLQPNGTWPDIQYVHVGRGEIPIRFHLLRMFEMAVAYNQKQCRYYKDANCLAAVNKALNHWLDTNYSNPNWWWVKIGFPKRIGMTMLLMRDELTNEQVKKGLKILEVTSIEGTAQNRVWMAGVGCLRGMLSDDLSLIVAALDAIKSELRITVDNEGVSPDFSFFQHGPMQQFANYGLSFLEDMPMWIYTTHGTQYGFGNEKLAVLRNYILKGQQWVVWKGRYDISCVGRHLHPDSVRDKALLFLDACRRMQYVDPNNAGLYKTILAQNSNEFSVNRLSGNNFFWRADYLIHRGQNYLCSVKMCSKRVKGTESILEENKLGRYLADGATYVYLSGREYENIFPVWDWQKIPGTTCVQSDISLMPTEQNSYIQSDFVGGLSDGCYGLVFMDLQRQEISGRKAWFFFESAIACLGTGIESHLGYSAATTVNQCLLSGEVLVGSKKHSKVSKGSYSFERPLWLYHNGIGYVFPASADVKLVCRQQTGKWSDVIGYLSDEPVSKNVFLLFIDHDMNLKNGEYKYFVLPDSNARKTAEFFKAPYIKILANNSRQQAVRSDKDKTIQIVFYESGICPLSDKIQIATDVPCAIMIREVNNKILITAADPCRRQQRIRLTISQRLNRRTVEIRLPQDELKSYSETIELEKIDLF